MKSSTASPSPQPEALRSTAQNTSGNAASERFSVAMWRYSLLAVILCGWEAYGTFVDEVWFSRPSLIFHRILSLAESDLEIHAATTFGEMFLGLAIGTPAGTLLGLVLGRLPVIAVIVRPIIFGLYSIPLVTLAPLFIFWFGLGMTPKVVLVAVVTFFLLFFTTFAGVQSIDRDMIDGYRLLGATRAELLRRVIGPACMAWILSGLKLALPYSLIAAVVGEMLLARAGLGYLLMVASQQIDMTGLYAVLIILMAVGVLVGESLNWVERRLMRWRTLAL